MDLGTVSRIRLRRDLPPGKLFRKGDILVCKGGEIGRATVCYGEIKARFYQNHLHRPRPLEPSQTIPGFAAAWLEEGFKHRKVYEGAGNRTTIPNLFRARLAELPMPHPNIDTQHETVNILDAIDRKIDLHGRKRALLEELFKALLHKLMTTKIRVAELDCSVMIESTDHSQE